MQLNKKRVQKLLFLSLQQIGQKLRHILRDMARTVVSASGLLAQYRIVKENYVIYRVKPVL